ncbi:MAG: nicotinate-nucleotide--dimethylbenzimidazole phosphoribosyltransferase [Ferrimicrobium sp.]
MQRLLALDVAAMADADGLQLRLTKPPGSLGHMELLGRQLCGIFRSCPPPEIVRPLVLVAAGDHGVVAESVTPWPQEVTAQMVANFLGGGAAINVLAREVGAQVKVVDAGVASDLDDAVGLIMASHGRGTANIAREAAMLLATAADTIVDGRRVINELIDGGVDLVVTGDMGIGNTTPSAAIISSVTGATSEAVTGRGTGIDDVTLAHKRSVVAGASSRVSDPTSATAVLAEVGGFEIGFLAGAMLGAAARGVPVVLDGVISLAAALIGTLEDAALPQYLIAGHRSVEPGASIALSWLGLDPILDLGMRLGEGSGGVLAVPIIRASGRVLREMSTFDSAGVSEKLS